MATTRRRRANSGTPSTTSAGTPAGGTVTAAGPGGPGVGPVTEGELATSASSDFGTITFFTVDSDGCLVRLDLTVPLYRLSVSTPNYNAKVAVLLAAWINRSRVTMEYGTLTVSAGQEAPRPILAITALPGDSDG